MRTLTDRTAVVTGAASGIGQALAVALAREGCRLALVDLNEAGLAETARRVEALGRPVSTHAVDVADRAAMLALPEAVIAAHGAVHILVNNAGVTVTKGFHEQSLDDFAWVMGVNLWGVVHGCHAFMDHLLRADEAHIVNLSSIFGVVGVPGQSSYCASKYAVRGFTETLWEELEGSHVGVTVVHPGGVATGIIEGSRTADPDAKARMARFFREKAMPPEAAAARIVAGIKGRRRRVLITSEAHAMDALKRLLPAWGNRWAVAALLRAMGIPGMVAAAQAAAIAHARAVPRPDDGC